MTDRRESPAIELVAYRVSAQHLPLRVASPQRQWMDETDQRFAYRCLPLAIANQAGWELLCPATFTATWSPTSPLNRGLELTFDGPRNRLVQSHFGHGVVTFLTGYLFRTSPGYDLWVKGPANQPKHGATPLEGIVETDWNMAPFTLNWKLTDPATAVRFVEGEPLCTILPIPRGMLASVQPRLAEIHDDPTLFDAYDSWRRSRGEFLRELRKPGSAAQQEKWQRDYFLGRRHDGTSVPDHATRLHLRPFADPAHDGEPAAIAASNTPDADPDSNDDTAKT